MGRGWLLFFTAERYASRLSSREIRASPGFNVIVIPCHLEKKMKNLLTGAATRNDAVSYVTAPRGRVVFTSPFYLFPKVIFKCK